MKSYLAVFKESASFLASRYGVSIVATVLGVLIVFALLYPVLFVVITSILRGNVIARGIEDIYKYGLSIEHYVTAITDQAFYSSLQVSILVSALTIITSLLVITPAAYGFSRFKFWGKDTMLFAYLVMSQVGGGFGVAAIVALFVFLAR
ncbi:MAG: sugar ABC transporter permease, partial [Desulfurococcaceae archaeon]